MRTVFLDTSFIIALEASSDQGHLRARQAWIELSRQSPRIVTTALILVELGAFFSRLHLRRLGVTITQRLLTSSNCEVVHIDPALLQEGWEIYARAVDKEYSLADCVSFVVMKQKNIREALTFDHHFEQAGFIRLPA